jgi:methylthioribose-1-phosphate isomerase
MSTGLSRTPLSGAEWFAVEFDPATQEVVMLDQRLLPTEVKYHRYTKPDEVADAIRDMVVRGAPAIGIAAAYALAMVARDEKGDEKMFLVAGLRACAGSAVPRHARRGRGDSSGGCRLMPAHG